MPAVPNLTISARPALDVEDLLQQLDDLHGQLDELCDLAGRKLDAIRAADARGLHDCTAAEHRLLGSVLGAHKTPALPAQLAQHLRDSAGTARRISDLADDLPAPQASRIHARIARVRTIARELQRKNQVVAQVARGLQEHLRGVFAAAADALQDKDMYTRKGQPDGRPASTWIDAVG